MPQTAYACTWALIVFILELSVPDIHPGFYITFDLFAWVGVFIGVLFFLLLQEPYYSGDGYSCPDSYGYCSLGKTVASVEIFGAAMAYLGVYVLSVTSLKSHVDRPGSFISDSLFGLAVLLTSGARAGG